MTESIDLLETYEPEEKDQEQEKPRILKSSLSPIESELMRLGPGL
jgi:hypothetical protein